MQLNINLKLFFISNKVRITLLDLSNVFIKNLYIKILHFLPFIFLKPVFFYNFVNYKPRLALFKVVKIKKLEYIYIDIF